MYDNCLHFSALAEPDAALFEDNGLKNGEFVLATIHRDNNTDEPKRLTSLFRAIDTISRENDVQIVLPLHPRTSKMLKMNLDKAVYKSIKENELVKLLPAVSYLDMIALEERANLIMTDSGGVQKEAYFFKKPCIILRPQTEWVELVENGNAVLVDADYDRIVEGYNVLTTKTDFTYPKLFGDGKSAMFICEKIVKNLSLN